jgi:hypothetical protein
VLAGYGVWGLTLPRGEVHVTSDLAGATVVIDNWFRGAAKRLRRTGCLSGRTRLWSTPTVAQKGISASPWELRPC